MLNDQTGELIFPVVRDGLNNPGMSPMPAMTVSQDDVKAIAEYIHSMAATAQRQGGPPPGPPLTLNILVGDAAAGKTYFAAKCSTCHSATGDLSGIGGRITNPSRPAEFLACGGGGRGANATPVTATVTLQNGQKVEGQLNRIDDFIVILTMTDGSTQSFRRIGDVPKVEIRDPRAAHRNLLPRIHGQGHSRRDCLSGDLEMKRKALLTAALFLLPALLVSQGPGGVDPASLLKPLADSWPTYSGDYTGQTVQRAETSRPQHRQRTSRWVG